MPTTKKHTHRNHKRGGRTTPRPNRRAIDLFATISSAARGCTCHPDQRVTHDHGITQVHISHDPGCPAHPGSAA